MCAFSRKLLTNLLILAVMALPYRMAFSMPIDTSGSGSGQHCKGMALTGKTQDSRAQDSRTQNRPDRVAAAGVDLAQMDSAQIDSIQIDSAAADCCSTGDGDCSGCTHITAVYFDVLQLSDLSDDEVFFATPFSFITRVISPPSRPPLVLHV
jgi:hypothetical protein